jgi:hypothetical protein
VGDTISVLALACDVILEVETLLKIGLGLGLDDKELDDNAGSEDMRDKPREISPCVLRCGVLDIVLLLFIVALSKIGLGLELDDEDVDTNDGTDD